MSTHDHDPDIDSDPAEADNDGNDWTSEGGATPAGPATHTENHPEHKDPED
jgi:hypothetical protein